MKKRCPICHQEFWFFLYDAHVKEHTRRLPDGQQKDHLTVPPAARYTGSLVGVPKVYYHARCGTRTGMPEEIIRSYLVNPFLYNSNTFCCGCHTYVAWTEVTWVETGERMSDYMQRLQDEVRRIHRPQTP